MAETMQDDSGGPTDQGLRELLDAEQHRHAASERRRRHWLRVQLEESRSFAVSPGMLDHRLG